MCSSLPSQRCHTGILFLIMLHRIATVSGNSLHSGNCVSSIKGSALVKHCYTSLLMHNMLACYYRCKEDKLCQSLNFYEKKNLCELNNRTRAVGSLNFLSHADSVYLDNPFRGKHFGFTGCLYLDDECICVFLAGQFTIDRRSFIHSLHNFVSFQLDEGGE